MDPTSKSKRAGASVYCRDKTRIHHREPRAYAECVRKREEYTTWVGILCTRKRERERERQYSLLRAHPLIDGERTPQSFWKKKKNGGAATYVFFLPLRRIGGFLLVHGRVVRHGGSLGDGGGGLLWRVFVVRGALVVPLLLHFSKLALDLV